MKPNHTILTTNEKICYKSWPMRNSIATISLPHNSFSFSCFLMFHYFSVSVPVLGQSPDSNNPVSRLSLVLGQREVMRGPRAHGTNCGIRSSARWPDLSLALIIDLSGQEMFTDLLLCNIFWYRISLVHQGRLPGDDISRWQSFLDILIIDFSLPRSL